MSDLSVWGLLRQSGPGSEGTNFLFLQNRESQSSSQQFVALLSELTRQNYTTTQQFFGTREGINGHSQNVGLICVYCCKLYLDLQQLFTLSHNLVFNLASFSSIPLSTSAFCHGICLVAATSLHCFTSHKLCTLLARAASTILSLFTSQLRICTSYISRICRDRRERKAHSDSGSCEKRGETSNVQRRCVSISGNVTPPPPQLIRTVLYFQWQRTFLLWIGKAGKKPSDPMSEQYHSICAQQPRKTTDNHGQHSQPQGLSSRIDLPERSDA